MADLDSELRRQIGAADGPAFQRALTAESCRRVEDFLKGVNAYHRHGYRRDLDEKPVVWQQGTTRLRDYGPPSGQPVLVVPSLINRAYILDLTARRSLLRSLARKGLRPFLVDWDEPGPEETVFGMEDYILRRLSPALDCVLGLAGRPVLLGYCMGGLLALALAAGRSLDLRGLVLLATPWDFHQPAPRSPQLLQAAMKALQPAGASPCPMSADLLQILFSWQDPSATERKFRHFAGLNPRSASARNFVALEDWANDGVPLSAKVAAETLLGWYGANQPGRGCWRIGGASVRPQQLALPALVMIPSRDRIVPAASAQVLGEQIPAARTVLVAGGHVGMLLGPRAVTEIYNVIAQFIRTVDGAARAAT